MEKVKIYSPKMKAYLGKYVIAEFKSYTLRGIVVMEGFDKWYIEYDKNNRLIIPGKCYSLTFYKHFGEDKPLQNYYREPRPSKDTL